MFCIAASPFSSSSSETEIGDGERDGESVGGGGRGRIRAASRAGGERRGSVESGCGVARRRVVQRQW